MPLLIVFILVPLIEIAVFVQVGGVIGLWPTLAIVVLTALIGASLVRQQGLAKLTELRQSMTGLRDPSQTIVQGLMILFAGALLLTPGFFTDFIGFAFLIPAIRAQIATRLIRHFGARMYPSNSAQKPDGDIIDVEYREVKPNSDTPWAPKDRSKGPF